jgi:hypothetical protein
MDRRTKILVSAFAVLVGAGLVRGVVYPTWILPLLTIDERIVERQKVLDVLEAQEAAVQQARHEYKALVARVGSFDVGKVETEVRDRLNRLIERHHLQDASVSPSRPVEDRKTGLWSTSISVSATGTLESTIAFLKELAELPYVARVGNPTLSPVGGGRKGPKQDLLSLRIPVDVLVLPQNRVVGSIQDAELTHPDSHVRHQGREYAQIWNRKPFSDYVPPIPLRATVARPVNVEKGQPATLEGAVSGGDSEYTIRWSPSEGVSDPTSLRPTVDTTKAETKTYTLTVTDGSGGTSEAVAMVTVREPRLPEPVAQVKPEPLPPPPPPGPKRWPEGRNMTIAMALLRTLGPERLDEFMVYNNKSKQTNYYKVGDEFDGGELVFVHQRGGVVRRNEDYFVYPIGANLEQHVEAKVADDYPELKSAADKIREIREARQKAKPAPPVAPEAQLPPSTEAPAEGEPAGSPDLPALVVPAVEGAQAEPTAEIRPAEGAEAKTAKPKRRTSRPPTPKIKP